jgi:hypothetical protein
MNCINSVADSFLRNAFHEDDYMLFEHMQSMLINRLLAMKGAAARRAMWWLSDGNSWQC